MSQTPPIPYQTVLNEVCQIYESTVLQAAKQLGEEKTKSYLEMGRRIATILAQQEKDGRYGKGLVTRLSKDIKKKYGKAPSTRTIRYMRKFATWYQPNQLHPQLSWSHYCVLFSIDDPHLRNKIEHRAIEQQLSRKTLQQLVSSLAGSKSHGSSFPLTPRKGRTNIAKVIWPDATDNPVLDVGFGVEYTPAAPALKKLKKVPHESHVLRTSDGRFKTIHCQTGERYCYLAKPINVIDGDTVKMRLQLTPTISIVERFRLRGVDAMEIGTPEGKKATRALARMLKNQTDITVYTYHTDRYGRYIADLITQDGQYINKQLVQKRHARFLSS